MAKKANESSVDNTDIPPDTTTPAKAEPVIEIRQPRVGDWIIYVLGKGSKHAGEARPAVATKEFDAKLVGFSMNVSCAHSDDFPSSPNPTWPVAPHWASLALYDKDGKPGTWHYAE